MDTITRANDLYNQAEDFRWVDPKKRCEALISASDLYLVAADRYSNQDPVKWSLVRLAISCLAEAGRVADAKGLVLIAVSEPEIPPVSKIQIEIVSRSIRQPFLHKGWPSPDAKTNPRREGRKMTISQVYFDTPVPNPKPMNMRDLFVKVRRESPKAGKGELR